jgi:FkbM family methyltransferase
VRSNYQEYLAWTYFGEQAFDRDEFVRLKETLQGTTRFIDVGASHGVYTYHANEILRNAEIIAIEADPERFQILQENAKRWAADSSNKIRCINAAASDEQDRGTAPQIEFYTTGTQISGGLFSVAERSDRYAPTRVPLVCLDDFFEPSSRTFVKIDVEGAELRVLKGAVRHLSAGNARFFTEISWWGDRGRGTNALDVLKFCLAHGLRVDRRLKSDYLMAPEPNATVRLMSVLRCLRPLGIRVAYDTIVPLRLRTWRERRQNRRRWGLWAPREGTGPKGATP